MELGKLVVFVRPFFRPFVPIESSVNYGDSRSVMYLVRETCKFTFIHVAG